MLKRSCPSPTQKTASGVEEMLGQSLRVFGALTLELTSVPNEHNR